MARFTFTPPDAESAEVNQERLLFRYGNGKNARLYNSRPERLTLRDTIRVKSACRRRIRRFDVGVHSSHFARMILKMVNTHIAPDKTFTR